METRTLELEVYTPQGLQLQANTLELSLPTTQGEIGILPLHTRYSGLLGTGIVQFMESEDRQSKRFVVSGGFVNLVDDKVTLLADSVDFLDSVDRDDYAQRREELRKILDVGNTLDPSYHHAKNDFARIEAIDRLISH